LEGYTHGGPYGALFNARAARLGLSDWVSLAMSTLMEPPRFVPATLSYLFPRLESQFTGEPTLLVLDEAWMFLATPQLLEALALPCHRRGG
jgi:type IV secretion system protein VirB4